MTSSRLSNGQVCGDDLFELVKLPEETTTEVLLSLICSNSL